MLRLCFAVVVFLSGLVAGCSTVHPVPRNGPPNVVLIVADDLGYGDLSCYGQERWRTPNLDRLAAEGVRLTNFYVAQPVCSASRAAILTGCYPNRVGVHGALGPGSKTGLDPAEVTIADMCKDRGYATGAFGKWHLGDAPNLMPLAQGFDAYAGIPYSNDMWPLHPDLVKLPPDAAARKRGYPPLPFYENAEVIDAEVTAAEQRGMTADLTERACAFVRANAAGPFFLYVPYPMPHVPILAGEAYEGRSGAGLYGDVIAEIDGSVGRIVEQIDSLGLGPNTLVMFTSDNGPWLSYGDHAGVTGGLREGKGTTWEGGVREPFIARWPGRLPAGAVRETPAMTIDFLPTVAGLVGGALPERRIDGCDLWPLLATGEAGGLAERPLAFYYETNQLQCVRRGRWKLILPHSYRTLAGEPGSGGVPGPYRQQKVGLELYDLETDPGETRNAAAANPEVVAKLTAVAEEFRVDLGDSLTGREGVGRRRGGESQK